MHIGTEDSYLCIEDRGATEKGPHQPYVHPGMNHMGFVVSDGAALAERMIEAGYKQGATSIMSMSYLDHPHRHRYYFFDRFLTIMSMSSSSTSVKNQVRGTSTNHRVPYDSKFSIFFPRFSNKICEYCEECNCPTRNN